MNILLSSNKKYLFATKVCIGSILKHNSNVSIYLLYSTLSDKDVSDIQSLFNTAEENHFFPIWIDKRKFEGVFVSGNITEEAYYRLVVLDVIPSTEDRALYLDTDIIVRKPLLKMYNMNLGNMCIAACEDWGMNKKEEIKSKVFKKLEFSDNDLYFNSGVLLFNLKKMREDFSTSYLLEFSKNNADMITYHDQDVLNYCCKGKIMPLDFMYNCRSYLFAKKDEPFILDNAYIIHYGPKPWMPEFSGICGNAFWNVAKELGYKKEYYEHKIGRIKNLFFAIIHKVHNVFIRG